MIGSTRFFNRGLADKMRTARKATTLVSRLKLAAELALVSVVPMLMQAAAAVEPQNRSATASFTPSPAIANHAATPDMIRRATSDAYVLGSRSFSIPYTVDTSTAGPIEVQLFVCHQATAGNVPLTWTLIESKRPTAGSPRQFDFTADNDGEFWFATRTTLQSGNRDLSPAVAPQLKVFVDTVQPHVEVVADADADGRVEVQLVIQDATPLRSMQLRYATDTTRTWTDVDISGLPADGRLSFMPTEAWEKLSLHLVVADSAGNQTADSKLLQRPRIAEAPLHRYAALPGGVDARQTPYRFSESEAAPSRTADTRSTEARPASGPVIQLDRRQLSNQASPVQYPTQKALSQTPGSNVYRSAPTYRPPSTGINGFRGAAFPQSPNRSSPSVAPESVPELVPPPEPVSALDRLFSPGQASPIDAPSIYTLPAPKTAPPMGASTLPPPASLDQISSGFGLNAPGNTPPAESIPAPTGSPDVNAPPSASKPAEPATPKPRPNRTLSEAMRPLSEQSAIPPTREEPAAKDTYQSQRITPQTPSSLISRVPIRFSDSERFSLEYELEAVGSQGVEAIELYGSTDEGRSWKLWGRDPDRKSPFDIETREEGVFGYRIVVVGGNGLASPRPQAGETPDIVVVVDKKQPDVRLTGARYGEGDRIGALVILYDCTDANLMPRPITLSFSPNLDGPWTTIAAGLSNDGDYVWPADPQLPRQFYLRIDATDQAGNVGTYILDQPIDAQGLAPRARIRGFQSISGLEPEAAFK